jgi:hypothetical protein
MGWAIPKNGKEGMTMEKAKSDAKITLTDGKDMFVRDITKEQLALIPKDGKEGKSITLKRGLVGETTDTWTERRVWQWQNKDAPTMYDLVLPTTVEKARSLWGDEKLLDYAISQCRVDSDHDAVEGGGKPKVKLSKEATEKLARVPQDVMDVLAKFMTNENLTVTEQALLDAWRASAKPVSPAVTPAMKEEAKNHGVGGSTRRK